MTLRRSSVLLASLALAGVGWAPPMASGQGGGQPVAEQPHEPRAIYDEQADAKEQIAAALARAKKENRRVLIQWGANWCHWCHLLHGLFENNGEVRRKLLYEYDVVLVDIGKWDKHMDLAAEYGADLKNSGVPFLTVLGSDGKVVTNQETESLEAKIDGKQGHDAKRVVDFLTTNQATYLDAETVLSGALREAEASNRIAFVHFGAPWCGWCHRLEDWLARPANAEVIEEDFVEVKIDIDRMIGGKEMLNRFRNSERGGIPWFAFLAPDGKTVVTSDGPDGNVGCPYTDEEIDAFGDMLRKARRNLSDEQIETLLQSMRDGREKK